MNKILKNIQFVDNADISQKRVLMRVDFNVSLNPDHSISNDERIKQALPTIEHILKNGNKLILMSHLGRPKGREFDYSLRNVAERLDEYLDGYKVRLIDDFYEKHDRKKIEEQKQKEVLLLENLRFYDGEHPKGTDAEKKKKCEAFAKDLSKLADVYVNDAFGVSHRNDASVVAIANELPSYGGLLLKREIEMIVKAVDVPKAPLVSVIGGAKISSKVPVISKLIEISDTVMVGGALANTFLLANKVKIGKSLVEKEFVKEAQFVERKAKRYGTELLIPEDVVVGDPKNIDDGGMVVSLEEVPDNAMILDIGPQTMAKYGSVLSRARTIVWNGPMGYAENPQYARGTDFLFYTIAENADAVSVVGGGDTIASISKKEYIEKISHISTGGGAMLEFVENETLPGIEALRRKK